MDKKLLREQLRDDYDSGKFIYQQFDGFQFTYELYPTWLDSYEENSYEHYTNVCNLELLIPEKHIVNEETHRYMWHRYSDAIRDFINEVK